MCVGLCVCACVCTHAHFFEGYTEIYRHNIYIMFSSEDSAHSPHVILSLMLGYMIMLMLLFPVVYVFSSIKITEFLFVSLL